METISTKTEWIKIDGWRGYEKPINAVAGASDTGNWSDSPCPTNLVKKELSGFNSKLRKKGIKYRTVRTQSSNVFMIKRWVCVSESNRGEALKIATEHQKDTSYFTRHNPKENKFAY